MGLQQVYGAGRSSPAFNLGADLYSGGATAIVSNSIANPTVVTTLQPHNLTSLNKVFFTASTDSNPLLTASPQQVVTVLSPTTFSVPVNAIAAGTAGGYQYAILSTPKTDGPPATAPLINVGRPHGLRVGDTVTIAGSGSTPDLNGAQVVTAVPSTTSFRVLTSAVPTTVAGSTTAGYYSKTTYYSDVLDRGYLAGPGAVVLTSVIGTAPCTSKVDLEGSVDGVTWYNVPYALVATPSTFVVTQITVTTGVATTYLLQADQPYRYLRVKFSTNTNVDFSVSAHFTP
jgi:hypothetical protein